MTATDAQISRIRRLIGDTCNTSASPYLLDNFEIDEIFTDTGSIFGAAVEAAYALAAHFAGDVDKRIDEHYQSSDSDKFEHYTQLAEKLQLQSIRSAVFAGIPFAGGISKAGKRTVEANSDRVAPAFTRELHDYVALSDTNREQE